MAVRRCLPWPNACLRTPAADVPAITDEVRAIWADMVDTMEAMPGYGLAAVQIGVPLRLAVVDCSEARGEAILMANPEVLHAHRQDLRNKVAIVWKRIANSHSIFPVPLQRCFHKIRQYLEQVVKICLQHNWS